MPRLSPKTAEFLRRWGPVIVWMGVIFYMSTDHGSSEHTRPAVENLIARFLPALAAHLTPEQLGRLDFALRKCGHISEYTILGALLFRALANPSIRTSRATAQLAIGIAIVYASSDEFHQLFVPSREAAIRDVLYDTLGATIGVTLTTLLHRRRPAPR